MKRFIIVILLIILVGNSAFTFFSEFNKKDKGGSFAVVELFTSQGCSSCPAADLVLDSLQQKFGENVYFLAYHVDYWNKSGWEDPYSRPEFSKYQRQYNNLKNVGVYTPMMVINGQDAIVGSKMDLASIKIENNLASNTNAYGLECAYEDGAMFIKYNPNFSLDAVRLNVAYVKKEAFTDIQSGENSGKVLRYTNIVQWVNYEECNEDGLSIVEFKLAPDKKDFEAIIYLQNKNTFEVLGATRFKF